MKVDEVLRELTQLFSLEIDAIHAYDAAVQLAPAGAVHEELALFRVEHQRHALELCEAILRLRRPLPEVEPDVKGYVIGALTQPPLRPTPERLLEAVRGNEQLTRSVYARAAAKPLPEDVRELVCRFLSEERHHVDWVEGAVDRRLWERDLHAHGAEAQP